MAVDSQQQADALKSGATDTHGRQSALGAIGAVWMRHFRVWLSIFVPAIVSGVVNPVFFLFAFGFGLGAVIDEVNGMPYLVFVVAGMICNAALFQASFEASIPSYTRLRVQRTYEAMLAAPISFNELVLGEVLWAASKGLLSALCLYVIGYFVGAIPHLPTALVTVPMVAISCMAFASFGLMMTAFAKTYEFFSYFFVFWIAPSLLFCGVFVEYTRYPEWVQHITFFYPIRHLIDAIRPIIGGESVDIMATAGHMAYIVVFFLVCTTLAIRRLKARLFD